MIVRRRWLAAGWSVLVAYSALHFVFSALVAGWRMLGGDVLSAFPGPLTVRVSRLWPWGAKPWIETEMARNGAPGIWNYGPVLHVVTLPFGLAASLSQAMHGILVADLVLVIATVLLWIELLWPGRRNVAAALVIVCVWMNHFPLLEAITGREIELLELFLITVGVWALRRDRQTIAGAAFGVAALTKFLPAIFIPYLFVKGYRKAGWAAALIAAVIALVTQPLLGWQNSVTLALARTEQTGASFPAAYANQGITNVLYKIFTVFNINEPRPATLYPEPLRVIGGLLSLAVLLATAWFIVRQRRSRLIEIECALLAIVMCLVVTHANTYYFVFVLPALSIGVAALWQQPPALSNAAKGALAGAITLSGFMMPMAVFAYVSGIQSLLVSRVLQAWSLPAFGAVLAAGLMVELHRVARARELD